MSVLGVVIDMMSPDVKNRILKLHNEQKLSSRIISKRLNVDYQTVTKVLKDNGLVPIKHENRGE